MTDRQTHLIRSIGQRFKDNNLTDVVIMLNESTITFITNQTAEVKALMDDYHESVTLGAEDNDTLTYNF